jgi:nicotinamidase/pyrazinamidase
MNTSHTLHPANGDALLIVDLQHDFLPGGALAVPHGDRVLGPIERAMALFQARGLPVFATRDWHPADHCSFRAQGGPWPPHCVAGSAGADFANGFELPGDAVVVSKGTLPDREAYSGFAGTNLNEALHDARVQRVFVAGLATDYCVLQTVMDAIDRGFDAVVLGDAVAAVDQAPGDGERALARMRARGARVEPSTALAA